MYCSHAQCTLSDKPACLLQLIGEGSEFALTAEEVETQAVRCNKKKKAAKIAGVGFYGQCAIHPCVSIFL